MSRFRVILAAALVSLLAVAAANSASLTQVGSIAGGVAFSCALGTDHRIRCWGDNTFGQLGDGTKLAHSLPAVVPGLENMLAVAAGGAHACAIDGIGGVFCWGDASGGQIGPGSTTQSELPVTVGMPAPAIAISAGRAHTCALLDTSQIYCWGNHIPPGGGCGGGGSATCLKHADEEEYYRRAANLSLAKVGSPPTLIALPAGFVPTQLVAGEDHDCSLSTDDRVACWGSNNGGQLGPLQPPDSTTAVEVTALQGQGVAMLSAGDGQSCAALSGGGVRCWGSNSLGALGDGGDMPSSVPVDVALPAGTVVTRIASGRRHSCAVTADDTTFCWGDNQFGQAGSALAPFMPIPGRVGLLDGKSITSLDAGLVHTCAVFADATATCWGANHFAQLGRGGPTAPVIPRPVKVKEFQAGSLVVLGGGHTCATTGDKRLACWGANGLGQLGIGTRMAWSAPVFVPGMADITSLAAGQTHTCAATSTQVWCWGRGYEDQLGNGAAELVLSPTEVENFPPAGREVLQLAGAGDSTCALLDNSEVWCWGQSLWGAGDGSIPTRVMGVPAPGRLVTSLSTGPTSSCVILDDQSLQCWGSIGVDDSFWHAAPTLIAGLGAVTSVSTGDSSVCAVSGNGIQCWGSDYLGMLGNDEASVSSNTPVSVAFPLGSAMPVAATGSDLWHHCARLSDGSAWCWGYNGEGQLGSGNVGPGFANSAVPTKVVDLTAVDALVTGGNHTCARQNGELYCWGSAFSGALGDGTAFTHSPEVEAAGPDRILASGFEDGE